MPLKKRDNFYIYKLHQLTFLEEITYSVKTNFMVSKRRIK
jgi:hypothetical protein